MSWTIRPLLIFAALNVVWELIQLPFYTIWATGSPSQIAYAVLHCTLGDVMIGTAAAIFSRRVVSSLGCRTHADWPFMTCFILSATAYTVFSEWLNVAILKSWAYSSAMPLLPPLGTGLTPVLQWIIVPILTWAMAGGCTRSRLAGRPVSIEGRAP